MAAAGSASPVNTTGARSVTAPEGRQLLTRLGLLALLALSPLSVGQEPPDAATTGEAPDAEAVAERDAVLEPADPDAPLDEYEASEQISEDLSVSFPVDI